MNFLTDLFNEIDEQNKPATQEQEKPVDVKTKLLDFEKMIADAARSSGVQPRTYLEQLCTKNPKFAESKLVKSLLGIVETEQESTMTVTNADKNANSKAWQRYKAGDSRYKYDKDAVPEQEQTNEDETSAVMDILAKHPAEYKELKDGESLYDQEKLFDALFQHFSATGEMPYGTQKARDGDPYEWIEDKLDDLGLLENMVEAFDDHKEDLAKELYYNGPNKEDIQNKYESLEEYMASEEFEDDATKLMYKFDSVEHVDEAVIREALDEAKKKKKGKKKPVPTSPEKWSRAKAKARSKFDVYPSAYANAYASKEYKKMGGGWRMGRK
jgi:hypothetical protein